MDINTILMSAPTRFKECPKDTQKRKSRVRDPISLVINSKRSRNRTLTGQSTISSIFSTPTTNVSELRRSNRHPIPSFVSPVNVITKSKSKEVKRSQTYIDLGQQSFGEHVNCSKCGLLYTLGEIKDEEEHKTFCKQRRSGISISQWKNERLIRKFDSDKERVIEIRSTDAQTHVKKLLEIKEMLDNALGAVSEATFLDRSHFLYINDKHVVGYISVENIKRAYPLDLTQTTDSFTLPSHRTEDMSGIPAVVGICQLWVHETYRRRQIATKLVDIVREKFIYGLHILKSQIAFAQPTSNGLNFAKTYMSPSQVLLYDDAN